MKLIENEWFIKVPWGKLCIVAWGDCHNPPVLLGHGGGDSLASFRPFLALLPTNFYYVGYEIPGHGRSDSYPRGLTVRLLDLAHCIELVRRHFRWERFIYMAHSLSGTIGRFYNAAHPGRLIAAIEIDQITPGIGVESEQLPVWFEYWFEAYYKRYDRNQMLKEEKTYTWDQMIEKIRKERPELTPELIRATIERHSEPVGDGKIRFTFETRRPYALRPPLTHAQYKTLYTAPNTPILGIITEGSIKKNMFENTPFLLEDHGNYRVKIVKGGHDIHIVHPERVAPFVSQFLLYGLEGLDRRSKI